MQTFNGSWDLNQHALLHNTSISNMKFIPHMHTCIPQSSSGLQKGFVTFSQRTDIFKRKQKQKRKIQRKVGFVRCRERERERERERDRGMGRNQQKAQSMGLAKWSTRDWWIQLTAVTPTREVFDESLLDAAESGDLAFPSGDFSVSRSRRPFFASHASEQLSLVSASREGPINFPFKFSGSWTCVALMANWESSKQIYISGSHAWTIPSAAKAMTANRLDVPFCLDDVGHWFPVRMQSRCCRAW